jgi:hypothetical protein
MSMKSITWQGIAIACAFLFSSVAQADDKDKELTEKALALLQNAIKAHGGEKGLEKAANFSRKGTGIMYAFNKEIPLNDHLVASLPDKFRFSVEAGPETRKEHFLSVINGEEGWMDTGAIVTELTKERLAELKEEAYVLWVGTLVPLTKDDNIQFGLVDDTKVDDKEAVGLKVSQKKHGELKLYFDKKTNLLVKIKRQAKESGVDVEKEYLYSDHMDVDGVKLPGKTVELVNGKKFTVMKASSYKLITKHEDGAFSKP